MKKRHLRAAGSASAIAIAFIAIANGCGYDSFGTREGTSPGIDGGDETHASLPDTGDNPFPLGDAMLDSGDGGIVLPPPTTVVIAPAGTVQNPTGNAQQTHVIHATHSGLWWLFTISSSDFNSILTYSSPDFVTWTARAPLALGAMMHSSEGGNFSVAYADLGGIDVVHVSVSLLVSANDDRRHFHSRATIAASAITWGSLDQVSAVTNLLAPGDNPDGPATAITADGHPLDLTGWALYDPSNDDSTGNTNAFFATRSDNGTGWQSGFNATQPVGVTVANVCNNHLAIATGASSAVALWEGGENLVAATNVHMSSFDGVTWNSETVVFANDHPMDANDWSAARLANGEIHAVRRTGMPAYDHRKYTAATGWVGGAAIPAFAAASESGIVVLASGNKLMLLTIGSDASISASSLNAGAWSAWTALDNKGVVTTRGFLSGYADPLGNAAVIWSEHANDGTVSVVGRRVVF